MSILTARFGPAGSDDSFAAMGYKKNIQIPEFLEKMGLNAFEYQCGRGVRINEEAMTKLGQLAAEKDIAMSLHAPYYISLSSVEEEKRRNSSNYILQSAQAVKLLGGDRIVVHSGSCSKISREEAVALAKEKRARIEYDEESMAPYFRYFERENGTPTEHVVWFENANSVEGLIRLVENFDLDGIGIWTAMKYFPQLWLVLNATYPIRKVLT